MVTNTRQIFHTTAANQHDRVLLEVVANTRDIGGHFYSIGEAHTSHLPESRIRLLRRSGVNTSANTAALRTGLQRWACSLVSGRPSPLTNKLIKGRHKCPLLETELHSPAAAAQGSTQQDHWKNLVGPNRAHAAGTITIGCLRLLPGG